MSARPFARFASALALALAPISTASEVEIQLDIAVTDITVLQAVPVNVQVKNTGPNPIVFSGAVFQGDFHGLDAHADLPEGRTWLSMQITDPSGAVLETDWTILVPHSEDPPHALSHPVESGGTSDEWNFLLGVAWDTPEQRAIFAQPGQYSVAVIARGPGFEVRSESVDIAVTEPADKFAQQASEVARSLKGRERQLFYSTIAASQLARVVILEGREAAPNLFALAEDEHDHPYRNYARAALVYGHVWAAISYTLPHNRSVDRVEFHLAEADRMMSDLGDQAPELDSHILMLKAEVQRLRKQNQTQE